MQCKVMHQIFNSFYSILKKWSKLGQKTDFLAHFERFFVYYTLLRLMIYAPIFSQILMEKPNVLWRYIMVVSFISVAFVVVKL